jgi:hypothetical protein
LGQGNFVASAPGGMGFPQLVQVTSDKLVACFSAILLNFQLRVFLNVRLLNICCARVSGFQFLGFTGFLGMRKVNYPGSCFTGQAFLNSTSVFFLFFSFTFFSQVMKNLRNHAELLISF